MALGSEHSPLLVGEEDPADSAKRTPLRYALRFAGAGTQAFRLCLTYRPCFL
jgi:hypothetical protein